MIDAGIDVTRRTHLTISLDVNGQRLWTGHTGGPIRDPNFHEGRMLTQLSPALEEALGKFQTMLELHGDPEGWIERQSENLAFYRDPERATDPATEAMVARVTALTGSTVLHSKGRWDGETEAECHQRLFGCSFEYCRLCMPIAVAAIEGADESSSEPGQGWYDWMSGKSSPEASSLSKEDRDRFHMSSFGTSLDDCRFCVDEREWELRDEA